MKRARTVLWSLVALAVALSLVMVAPVYAANVALTKGVAPTDPVVYNLTDTIHYVMSIINMNSPTGGNESIVVQVVSDVLPDGSTVYPTGPALPYTLAAGENQTYTYDWVPTRTGNPLVNTFHASGYQISTGNDTFDLSVEKSSVVIGAVGGTASLVNKLWLVAPWAFLLGCAGIAALAVLRKRRQA